MREDIKMELAQRMDPIVECLKFYTQHRPECSGAEIACACGLSQLREKALAELQAKQAKIDALKQVLGYDKRDILTLRQQIERLAGALQHISEATVMKSYDAGEVIGAGYKEQASAALKEVMPSASYIPKPM